MGKWREDVQRMLTAVRDNEREHDETGIDMAELLLNHEPVTLPDETTGYRMRHVLRLLRGRNCDCHPTAS